MRLSNVSEELILYALSSYDGAVATIVVNDKTGAAVSQAFLSISLILEAVKTTVATGYTDDSDQATFFLNPLKLHEVTINKTGCVFTTRSFNPASGTTTFTIDCGYGGVPLVVPHSGIVSGLEFRKTPASGPIANGINNFELRVMSERSNIQKIRIELAESNGTVLQAIENTVGSSNCLNYDCYVNMTYDTNLTQTPNLKGRYYVDLGNGWLTLEGDAYWTKYIISQNISSNLNNFLRDIIDVFNSSSAYTGDLDQSNRAEFSRIMFIFIIMCLLLAAFNKFSGYDSANPGAFLVLMTGIFVLGSAAGGRTGEGLFYLDGLTPIHFLNNYIIAMYMFIITATYFLNVQRRNS
jgi:hypothetical protein